MRTIATAPAPDQSIEIVAITRLKHAVLWDAVREAGGIKAVAKHLGVSSCTLGNWINLHSALKTNGKRWSFSKEKTKEIAFKLCKLTGKHINELFPDFLVDNLKELDHVKEQRQNISAQRLNALTHYGTRTAKRLTWDAKEVDRTIDNEECREAIKKVLRTLSYREREILKLRFGLGEDGFSYTLEEVGHIFKVTRDRIRQIEMKAIRKLQQPSRSAKLVGFVTNPQPPAP